MLLMRTQMVIRIRNRKYRNIFLYCEGQLIRRNEIFFCVNDFKIFTKMRPIYGKLHL